MHPVDAVILMLSCVAAIACASLTLRCLRTTRPLQLALAVIAGLGAAFTLIETAAWWLAQPADPWNAARLTPAIALHHGFKLYYPLHTGPVLSTIVGPTAFLVYWPIGFFHVSPTPLILLASALNLFVFALLGFALVRRIAPDNAIAVFTWLAGGQFLIFYPSLRYSLFSLHADASALLFGGVGAGLIIFASAPLTWKRCFAVGLCLALGVWAKQSIAPIYIALLAIVALHHGVRGAGAFVASAFITGIVVSSVYVSWLGFSTLCDNMFLVPAQHPWRQMNLATGEIYDHVQAVGATAHAKVLLAGSLHIIRDSWLLFALLLAALGGHYVRRTPGDPHWPRLTWASWLIVAFSMLPTAAIGRAKVGGEVNHESFVIIFLVVAFLCWLAALLEDDRTLRLTLLGAVLAVLLIVNAPRLLEYDGWRAAWDNQNELSYHYDCSHLGERYFPWNPLSGLLAEGKLYHFDYGVFDRNLGGAQVSPEHIAQYLPSPRPVIASTIAHHDYILHTYFPDYVEYAPDPGLPGWRIYGPH